MGTKYVKDIKFGLLSIEFHQMTTKEIKELKEVRFASRILELSEENKIFKNGKIYHPSSYEAREIVKSLKNKMLNKLKDISFAILEIEINDNGVTFGINKDYFLYVAEWSDK